MPRTPGSLLIWGFAALIAVGSLLLRMPWSHRGALSLLDAAFTATSAVCVTGLTVVDTGSAYTPAGQASILVLIETGGLGVMTFAALVLGLLGRRLPLAARAALGDSLVQREFGEELRALFPRLLALVVAVQSAGALLLWAGLGPAKGWAASAWSAVFHAVSAFCNAGFSLYADNAEGLRGRPLVLATLAVLIVAGGIGHPVLVEIGRRALSLARRERARPGPPWSLHARVALWTSAALIAGGAVILLLTGLGPGVTGTPDLLSAALFQSVSARTAGFNSVPIGAMPIASLWLLVLLMAIGGSPASCAGGIKTTTFVVWGASVLAFLRGRGEVRVLDRRMPDDVSGRATAIVGLALLWSCAGVLLLSATEAGGGAGLHDVVFEQVSAFGTVGLSTGLTPRLSAVGKLWIMATMFVGRLGPLTIATWAVAGREVHVQHPEGRVMIG